MIAAVAVAVCFAAGVLLLVDAVWPPTRSLAGALHRLHAPGRPVAPTPVAGRPPPVARIGRWFIQRAGGALVADERTLADLAILRRPPELHAGAVVLATLAGALAGPVLWAVAALGGITLPALFPLWLVVAGAVIGWSLPRALLRAGATRERRDFRHALGAFLDVLVLLLAGQEGPESAMELAAQAGRGPAFDELRRATWQARLSGDAVWTALGALGRRVAVPELEEIAAAGSLAGEAGAAVRKSLTAKATSLRAASLAAAEASARRQSQAMFAPLVLMGLGFVAFLIYPLVTNLSVGGP